MSIDIINKLEIIDIKERSHKMCFWVFLNHFFCKFIKSIAVINICKRICARQYLKLFLMFFCY